MIPIAMYLTVKDLRRIEQIITSNQDELKNAYDAISWALRKACDEVSEKKQIVIEKTEYLPDRKASPAETPKLVPGAVMMEPPDLFKQIITETDWKGFDIQTTTINILGPQAVSDSCMFIMKSVLP